MRTYPDAVAAAERTHESWSWWSGSSDVVAVRAFVLLVSKARRAEIANNVSRNDISVAEAYVAMTALETRRALGETLDATPSSG